MRLKTRIRHLLLSAIPLVALSTSGFAGAAELYEGTLDGIYPQRNEIVIDDGSARIDSRLVVHLSKYRRGTVADLAPGTQVRFALVPPSGKGGEMPRITEIWVLRKGTSSHQE